MRHEEGSLPGWGWEHKETDIYKVSSSKKPILEPVIC
jgi:hypothetical protein